MGRGGGGSAWFVLGAPLWLRGAVLALGSGILPERRAVRSAAADGAGARRRRLVCAWGTVVAERCRPGTGFRHRAGTMDRAVNRSEPQYLPCLAFGYAALDQPGQGLFKTFALALDFALDLALDLAF